MARPRTCRSPCRSLLPLGKKQARLSSFNQSQRYLWCTFAASWALIYRAAEITQGVPTNKQWLLCSHYQYFSRSSACASTSAPKALIRSPNFNSSRALKATFKLQIFDLYCGVSHINCYHFSLATSLQAQPQERPLKYENYLWYCQGQWLQSYLIAALSLYVSF